MTQQQEAPINQTKKQNHPKRTQNKPNQNKI